MDTTMTALHRLSLTAAAISFLAAAFTFSASAQTNRATFPADFDKYVLYATYGRGSAKEEAFAKPATLEIAKSGAPLPITRGDPGIGPHLGSWARSYAAFAELQPPWLHGQPNSLRRNTPKRTITC
jgi:hypothetical protein